MGSAVRRTREPAAGTGARRRALGTTTLCAVLLTTGCTDTTRPPEDLSPPPVPATSTGPVRPDPNFASPETLDAAMLSRFPQPEALGRGWTPVTLGSSQVAALGVRRDVREVMDGSVPEECRRPDAMPVADRAGQRRYVFEGVSVNAFVLRFFDADANRAFFEQLVHTLQNCRAETDAEGEDVVGQVLELDSRVVLSDRYPDSTEDRRAELAVLTDGAVVLLEAPTVLGARPFTSGGSLAIARAFREAAGHATNRAA